MKKTFGVVGSLFIHILVLILLLSTTSVAKRLPKKQENVPVHTMAREDRLKGEETTGDGLACSGYHYTGIGIRINYGSGTITDVGPNTPAAVAGLREGDVLVEPNQLGPDRFVVGTVLVLDIIRAGVEMKVPIHIGRICNE